METLFPVFSNPIRKEFNIEPGEIVIENRYKPYLKRLEWCFNNYIKTLFNSTRYDEPATLKPRDYHFPIKVSIKAIKEVLVQDVEVIREPLDQVHQLGRMCWKSIGQHKLPVTKYPEMVAEIFPHFEHNQQPEFGNWNLWFL